ncbi:MAG TPA: hypothetical protein VM056_02665 [Terriglobales bacterium]|nr:hypothetical protein [Terriglobales bacterium]
MTKRWITAYLLLIVLLLHSTAFAGLGSDKAMYVGGTVNAIKEGTEGTLSGKDEKVMLFTYGDKTLQVPYERINDLEYGQKAGRRLGVAIALTWMALFSKKRKHYLTVGYLDDNDKQQAAVFELGKGTVRVTLATLEARSGRKVDYEDAEARNAGRN